MEPATLSLITDVIDPLKQEEFLCFGDDNIEEEENEDDGMEDEYDNMEDEDDAMEDEEDEISDDDSLDDEENEGSVSDEKQLKMMKLKQEMQVMLGIPGEEDIDIDSVPEKDLKALDKNIGSMMKSYFQLKDNKKKKLKLAKDETELLHFRIR